MRIGADGDRDFPFPGERGGHEWTQQALPPGAACHAVVLAVGDLAQDKNRAVFKCSPGDAIVIAQQDEGDKGYQE